MTVIVAPNCWVKTPETALWRTLTQTWRRWGCGQPVTSLIGWPKKACRSTRMHCGTWTALPSWNSPRKTLRPRLCLWSQGTVVDSFWNALRLCTSPPTWRRTRTTTMITSTVTLASLLPTSVWAMARSTTAFQRMACAWSRFASWFRRCLSRSAHRSPQSGSKQVWPSFTLCSASSPQQLWSQWCTNVSHPRKILHPCRINSLICLIVWSGRFPSVRSMACCLWDCGLHSGSCLNTGQSLNHFSNGFNLWTLSFCTFKDSLPQHFVIYSSLCRSKLVWFSFSCWA